MMNKDKYKIVSHCFTAKTMAILCGIKVTMLEWEFEEKICQK